MIQIEGQVVVSVSVIVALAWLALFIYFVNLYRTSWRSEPRFAMVLAVLMLDAFRNLVESAYLGVVYSGRFRMVPRYIDRLLWAPQVTIVTRLLTLATAMVILWLVMERGFYNLQLREQRSVVLEQRNRELTALQQLTALVSGTLETPAVLNRVCREIVETLSFRSAMLCLIDEEAGVIRGAAGYGVPESLIEETQRSLDGPDILAAIARTGATEVVSGWDDRFDRETFVRFGHAGLVRVFAPIQDAQGTVGAVEATVKVSDTLPDAHRLALLHSFLGHACAAIRNARLHERVLTDRERLNRLTHSLEDKNKQLESFVYMVSHDLKAPLVSIQGFLSLLEIECATELPEEGRFYLNRVRGNTEHLQRLIQQLLELSRVGRAGDLRERVDMDALAQEIKETMEPRLQPERITLEIVSPLPPVMAEPTQIRQLIVNLVDNSIKYMGASLERRIEIRSEVVPEGVEYVVTDTGMGIPEEMRERAFQMFQRLPNASSSIEGSGMGLAIVRKIAEAHGGSAWVEANPGGTGSAFHILIAPAALSGVISSGTLGTDDESAAIEQQ